MNKHYLIFINLFAVCSIIADECASEDDVNRKPTSVAYHLSQTASNAVASNIAGISNGGTGKDTFTAYAVLAGGITSQSPLQQISGVGTAGQVLTSAGAGALPTWQDGAGGGGIQTITGNTGGALTGSNINFTGGTTGLSFEGSGTTQTLTFAGITANGGTVSLATDATASTINIGTGAGVKTTTVGSTTATSTTTLQAGSGGVKLGTSSAGAVVTNSSSVLSSVNGTAGQALIAAGAGSSPNFGTLGVVGGGTGNASLTAYALLAGGTTTTGNLQQVSGLGASGQVLTSAGAGALPTWSTVSSGLPGYIAGTGFLFAGRSTSLSTNPNGTIIISNSSTGYTDFTSGATNNIFIGDQAGVSCTSGSGNLAFGFRALTGCQNGGSNVALGVNALRQSFSGINNCAVGGATLDRCQGSYNVALGANAGFNLGAGDYNIYIGYASGPTSQTDQERTIEIGNILHDEPGLGQHTYIHGISGATSAAGAAVLVNSDGKLGTSTSSRRFKENIENVNSATADKILNLDVVQFNYKNDENQEVQYGMIAEDVEPIFPEMIVYDKEGIINTIQYHKLLPLVIKELQTVVNKSQEMQSAIDQLKQENIELKKMIDQFRG